MFTIKRSRPVHTNTHTHARARGRPVARIARCRSAAAVRRRRYRAFSILHLLPTIAAGVGMVSDDAHYHIMRRRRDSSASIETVGGFISPKVFYYSSPRRTSYT